MWLVKYACNCTYTQEGVSFSSKFFLRLAHYMYRINFYTKNPTLRIATNRQYLPIK
jgi:hypothetical protein